MIVINILVTTETGTLFFSERQKTVVVSDKGECCGSRGLKLSNEKVLLSRFFLEVDLSFSLSVQHDQQTKVFFYNISFPEDRNARTRHARDSVSATSLNSPPKYPDAGSSASSRNRIDYVIS